MIFGNMFYVHTYWKTNLNANWTENTWNHDPVADQTSMIMFTLKSYIPNPIWLSCIRVPAFLTLLRLRPSPGCDTEPNRVQTTKFSPLIFTVSPPYVSPKISLTPLEYMWIRWCLFTSPHHKTNKKSF